MNNNTNFNVGDVVTFMSKQGATIEGVITQLKVKTPGKRKLSQIGLGHLAHSQEVAIISTPGSTSYWTVPLRMLTFVRKSSADQVMEARKVVSNVKYSASNAKSERIGNRVDKIFEFGLDKLNSGDKIKIRFRDRFSTSHYVKECTYLGQTSSLRLRILPPFGKEMSVTPSCVVVG